MLLLFVNKLFVNSVLSFNKHYARQVFPHEKEVKVLLLTRRVQFASHLYSSS